MRPPPENSGSAVVLLLFICVSATKTGLVGFILQPEPTYPACFLGIFFLYIILPAVLEEIKIINDRFFHPFGVGKIYFLL